MIRSLLLTFGALTSLLAAQSEAVPKDLLAEDWRARNTTANTLAKAPSLDLEGLVRVLQTDWTGALPAYGAGGRYGGRRAEGPRLEVMALARQKLVEAKRSPLSGHLVLESADQLDQSWHPHDLAAWVLRQRRELPEQRPSVQPTSRQLAQAWLRLAEPSYEQLLASCENPALATYVTMALWRQGEAGREQLRRLLVSGSRLARQRVLELSRTELLDGPEEVAAAAEQFLRDKNSKQRRHAGSLLLALGRPAATALAAACGDDRSQRRRALGLLCLLKEHAAPALTALLANLESDRISRQRALAALVALELPATVRTVTAARLLALLQADRDTTTNLLAIDLLARCGDGVAGELRAALQAMLPESPIAETEARLLGCLRRLNAVPDLSPKQKAAIAAMQHATTDTWLTIADDGIAGAGTLRPFLVTNPRGIDVTAVIARLAETAPGVVLKWLDDNDPDVALAALNGLRKQDPSGLPSADLVARLDREPRLANALIAWLSQRSDANRFAPQVFARITELTERDISYSGREFAQNVDLPLAQKLTLMATLLRRGVGWDAVRNTDEHELLRTELRRWLAEADPGMGRSHMLGELCRVGLKSERDFELVRDGLRAQERFWLLFGLEHGPDLPEAIRRTIEEQLAAGDDASDLSSNSVMMRAVLAAHR